MSAKEMFKKLGYELINHHNIVYKGKHETGRIIHIAFFDDKKILITQSIGVKELQAINKAIELLGNYKHYSTPDEEQNSTNEALANKAFDILKEVEHE